LKYGRWSKQWNILQARYDKTNKTTRDAPWLNKITQKLWDHAHLRWTARNTALHGKTANNTTKENLIARIRAAYTHQEKMLVQDHHPFQRSIEEWERQPASAMQLWLKRNLPYIQHCIKVAQTQLLQNTKDIRQFMEGTPKTPVVHNARPRSKRRRFKQIHQNLTPFMTKKRQRPTGSLQYQRQKKRYFKSQDRPPDKDNPQKTQVPQKVSHQLNLFESFFQDPR